MAKKTNLVFSRKFEGELLDDVYEIGGKEYYLNIIKNYTTGDVCYEISNIREHEKLILFARVQRDKDPIGDYKPNLNDADKFKYFLIVDGGCGIHKSEMIKNPESRRIALLCLLNRMYYDVYPFDPEIKLYWKINDAENEKKPYAEQYKYFTQDEIALLGEKTKYFHANQVGYDYVMLDKKTVKKEFRTAFLEDEPQRQ